MFCNIKSYLQARMTQVSCIESSKLTYCESLAAEEDFEEVNQDLNNQKHLFEEFRREVSKFRIYCRWAWHHCKFSEKSFGSNSGYKHLQ